MKKQKQNNNKNQQQNQKQTDNEKAIASLMEEICQTIWNRLKIGIDGFLRYCQDKEHLIKVLTEFDIQEDIALIKSVKNMKDFSAGSFLMAKVVEGGVVMASSDIMQLLSKKSKEIKNSEQK